jgi:DNA-binding response OmpR family regulator
MENPTVLFADDDREAHQIVKILLEKENIYIVSAYDGRAVLDIWPRRPVDLFILDWIMPEMDGFEVLEHIRHVSHTPVILVTAKGQEADIVAGFEAGANDYLVKPYLPGEFLARVKTRLRRGWQGGKRLSERLEYDGVVLEMKNRRVVCQGRAVELSKTEFQVLAYLFIHAGLVISKQELIEKVWGYTNEIADPNLLEAVITRLRKKFKDVPGCPEYLQTVRSAGYRFGD